MSNPLSFEYGTIKIVISPDEYSPLNAFVGVMANQADIVVSMLANAEGQQISVLRRDAVRLAELCADEMERRHPAPQTEEDDDGEA